MSSLSNSNFEQRKDIMGINKIFELPIAGSILREYNIEFNIYNKSICVDSSYIIYKFFHSTNDVTLSSRDNIARYSDVVSLFIDGLIKSNVKMIWVFDGAKNILKYLTHKTRSKIIYNGILEELKEFNVTEDDIIKIDKCDDGTINVITSVGEFTIISRIPSKVHSEIIKSILTENSIEYVISDRYEAEHTAVTLCKKNNYDGVLSMDTDVLMFGGNLIIMKQYKYYCYELDKILKQLNLSYKDFCKICIILGCDFCDKIDGIGPKTVIKKYNNIELPMEHTIILNYVMLPSKYNGEY